MTAQSSRRPPRPAFRWALMLVGVAVVFGGVFLLKAYFAKQRLWHPDRFVAKPADERAKASVEAAALNDAYRTLQRFAAEAGLSADEALVFLFEHFNSVTHHENLTARLRLFKAELEDRKA